ncbi:hypothetical protein BV000_00075A, partial [Haemophilus influenzae]
MKKWL